MVTGESKRTLAELTARNGEIARLLERLRSKTLTDNARAKDAALQEEFDANQSIIIKLTNEIYRDAAK